MKLPLRIRFGRSTSCRYSEAVRLAVSLPGYRSEGDGRAIVHEVQLDVSLADQATWSRVQKLLQTIGMWASTDIQANGEPYIASELLWKIARIRSCYAEKQRLSAGDEYCSCRQAPTSAANVFGCHQCKSIARATNNVASWRHERSWIAFGKLSPDAKTFHVSKQAIVRTLRREAKHSLCIYCPAFSNRRLRADVDELPDTIDLATDRRFELRYASADPTKAIGIRLKEQEQLESEELPVVTTRQIPSVRFADVAGQNAALERIKNAVQLPLIHADHFVALGVQPQAGILLYGPPGSGKTLIVAAVAGECQAHFEIISGPEILSKWLGESEANLRDVFARARQLAPSIVLIDEIDCLAPRRETTVHHHDVRIVSQLLVLLDGLEARGCVAVLATTNRLEAVDPAVRRPGRFDCHFEVALPDPAGREAILRVHLAKMRHDSGLPIAALAASTEGWSGAELAALCREAGLEAILRGLRTGLAPGESKVSSADLHVALQMLRHQCVGGK